MGIRYWGLGIRDWVLGNGDWVLGIWDWTLGTKYEKFSRIQNEASRRKRAGDL